jgi:hypothetical protein
VPQLREFTDSKDPRLRDAARLCRDGEATQFLAAAPDLLSAYENAPAGVKAILTVAMDARLWRVGEQIPLSFLEAATPTYITDSDWHRLPHAWFEESLKHATQLIRGVTAPPTKLRPRPGEPDTGESYRLADYLAQQARAARHEQGPPAGFWTACESMADPAKLRLLGMLAARNSLVRMAARLYKRAAERGDANAALELIRIMGRIVPDSDNPAWGVVKHVVLDDASTVTRLMDELSVPRAAGAFNALIERRPGSRVDAGDVKSTQIMWKLWSAGAREQAHELAGRAAACAPLDDPREVSILLSWLRTIEAVGDLDALVRREPATRVRLDKPRDVIKLVWSLCQANAQEAAVTLVGRMWKCFDWSNPRAILSVAIGLLDIASSWGKLTREVTVLVSHDFVRRCELADPGVLASVLSALRVLGAEDEIRVLLDRDPARMARLGDAADVHALLNSLQAVGATEQVRVLRERTASEEDRLSDMAADKPPAIEIHLSAEWLTHSPSMEFLSLSTEKVLEKLEKKHLYPFGREPDGTPAGPWDWEDLDL